MPAIDILRDGIDHGVRLSTGDADMLGWRYAKHAPNLLAAVAGLLAGHDESVRRAFLNEATKDLDAEQRAGVSAAIGL